MAFLNSLIKKEKPEEFKFPGFMEDEFKEIYMLCKEYTMTSVERMYSLYQAVNYICNHNIPGDIVECGVWRGGMLAAIVETLNAKDRPIHVFDSFQGLPEAKTIDGEDAIAWQSNPNGINYHDNCKAEKDYVASLMENLNCTNTSIYEGWFEDTIPQTNIKDIALLRLDADWYESTKICLDFLFDNVIEGGLIILDDYFAWDGCSRALHDFLSERKAIERINSCHNYFCYLIKRS